MQTSLDGIHLVCVYISRAVGSTGGDHDELRKRGKFSLVLLDVQRDCINADDTQTRICSLFPPAEWKISKANRRDKVNDGTRNALGREDWPFLRS